MSCPLRRSIRFPSLSSMYTLTKCDHGSTSFCAPNPPLRPMVLPPLLIDTSTQISFESVVPWENRCPTFIVLSTTSRRYFLPGCNAGTAGRIGAMSLPSTPPPSLRPKISMTTESFRNSSCFVTISGLFRRCAIAVLAEGNRWSCICRPFSLPSKKSAPNSSDGFSGRWQLLQFSSALTG